MSDQIGAPWEQSLTKPSSSDALVDALVQASFTTMGVLNRVAGEHDLSLTQLRVLAILRDRRVKMSALAQHLGLEKSTMSGLVQRAEGRGLVQRGSSPDDGRAVEVFLTERGKELAERIGAEVEGFVTPWTARLEISEQVLLQRLLSRVLGG